MLFILVLSHRPTRGLRSWARAAGRFFLFLLAPKFRLSIVIDLIISCVFRLHIFPIFSIFILFPSLLFVVVSGAIRTLYLVSTFPFLPSPRRPLGKPRPFSLDSVAMAGPHFSVFLFPPRALVSRPAQSFGFGGDGAAIVTIKAGALVEQSRGDIYVVV